MLDIIFKYYGLDWIIFGIVVCHLYLLKGQHKNISYICGACAAFLGIGFNFWISSVGGTIANFTFLCLHLRNLYSELSHSESLPSSSSDDPHILKFPLALYLPEDADSPELPHSHKNDKHDHTP